MNSLNTLVFKNKNDKGPIYAIQCLKLWNGHYDLHVYIIYYVILLTLNMQYTCILINIFKKLQRVHEFLCNN